MILTQLDILQPKRSFQTLSKQLETSQKQFAKYLAKTRRNALATVRSQYMIDDAVIDTRRAVKLNEDIFLASLLIIAVLSFSTVSILANTLYTFMLTATFLSELSGASMIVMSIAALGVLSVSILWTLALMQNLVTISLMEAVTRKRNRSLRLTIRKSLQLAPTTVIAWLTILFVTFAPVMALLLVSLIIVFFGQVEVQTALPYLAGAGVVSASWIIYSLANFSLLTQVMLFGKTRGLTQALKASRQLVKRKGRYFSASTYVLLAAMITVLFYGAIGIESATGIDRSLPFLTALILPLTISNALQTMLYRKRKLARR